MDISLHVQFPVYDPAPAFVVTVDADRLGALAQGDLAWLTTQASIRRGVSWDRLPQPAAPLLLDLHGVVCGSGMHPPAGMPLRPPEELPLSLPDPRAAYLVTLTFPFPRSLAQQLEDDRAATRGQQDLRLTIRLWGSVLLRGPGDGSAAIWRVHTEGIDPELRIARSDWLDRLLVGMGYPARRSIALPVLAAEQPPETREAAAQMAEAWSLFHHERYREAVQRCRQARDALLGPKKPTWAHETLDPVIGADKAAMIDESIAALNHLGHAASHGTSGVAMDRDTAEFVLGSLTLILHYVGRQLR